MWPDRVSNPGPLTYESGALPTALRGPAADVESDCREVWFILTSMTSLGSMWLLECKLYYISMIYYWAFSVNTLRM